MIASPVPARRKVLVSGAAGGLGRAIIEALLSWDCQIAACDLDPGVEQLPGLTAAARFDVSDRGACERAVGELIGLLGGCDAVVANAGLVDTIHRAERFPEQDWRRDLEVNLSGQFHLVQAAYEALAASGDGRVVLISSASAQTGLPGQVAYTASKAGVVGMARTLAGEWGDRGIRVNVVMPGLIATPKVRALPDGLRQGVEASIPLRRIGETEELAGVVAFLLSPAAAYMTGAVVRVDGGFGLSTGGLMTGR